VYINWTKVKGKWDRNSIFRRAFSKRLRLKEGEEIRFGSDGHGVYDVHRLLLRVL